MLSATGFGGRSGIVSGNRTVEANRTRQKDIMRNAQCTKYQTQDAERKTQDPTGKKFAQCVGCYLVDHNERNLFVDLQ